MPTVLVTHDLEEARLLADRMVVIERGAMVRSGSTADVLFDPAALRAMGLRDMGSSLPAVIEAEEEDGLTRLMTSVGPIWLPRVDGRTGASVRLRIAAHDVMIARDRPTGISALNVLPATVIEVAAGDGPGVIVRLDIGGSEVLARLTARSARTLALAPGVACHAVIKSMAAARGDVETPSP